MLALSTTHRGATIPHVMEMLVLNLDIRFPCPSFSVETSLAKRKTDKPTCSLKPDFLKEIQMKCVFLMEVDLFEFPDCFIKTRQINPWFIRQYPEVQRLLMEIVENERSIFEMASKEKPENEDDHDGKGITLFDVFRVVDQTKYPFLWGTVLRVLSYTPTSVSCEQSFSILKRRMHQNMKKETAFMFVEMAKRNKVIEFE